MARRGRQRRNPIALCCYSCSMGARGRQVLCGRRTPQCSDGGPSALGEDAPTGRWETPRPRWPPPDRKERVMTIQNTVPTPVTHKQWRKALAAGGTTLVLALAIGLSVWQIGAHERTHTT